MCVEIFTLHSKIPFQENVRCFFFDGTVDIRGTPSIVSTNFHLVINELSTARRINKWKSFHSFLIEIVLSNTRKFNQIKVFTCVWTNFLLFSSSKKAFPHSQKKPKLAQKQPTISHTFNETFINSHQSRKIVFIFTIIFLSQRQKNIFSIPSSFFCWRKIKFCIEICKESAKIWV